MKNLRFVKDFGVIILSALVMAFLLQAFVFDTRFVPTASMHPTVAEGDRLINNKLTYRFSGPKRGDIVVFAPPAELEKSDDLLKRIIGLPGETVEIKDGKVYINDEPLDEPYITEAYAPKYTFGPATVPEGHYFVLGDNRNNSKDSHEWEDPFLPRENIKGKVWLRFEPFERFGAVK
ncbi:MAG: signal peptidase I [Clostridiales bacterium]|nr:signal peptidase I [Clostridiales bacterium]